jgi:hypothetical protein
VLYEQGFSDVGPHVACVPTLGKVHAPSEEHIENLLRQNRRGLE